MLLGQLDIHIFKKKNKNNLDLFLVSYTKINSVCMLLLKVKGKTIKLLEKHRQIYSGPQGKERFLNMIKKKAPIIKGRTDILKLKTSVH